MNVKKAWFVGVDGSIKQLPELERDNVTLKDLYPIIGNGCHIAELVSLKNNVELWADEEALLRNDWEPNAVATQMYRDAWKTDEVGIVGNAVIIDNTESGDYITNYLK